MYDTHLLNPEYCRFMLSSRLRNSWTCSILSVSRPRECIAFRCLRNLWIIDIQLSEISVDLEHPAVCDICRSAISGCVRYLWMQQVAFEMSAKSVGYRYSASWDICGSATFTCLWNLWIRNNYLSSQPVNMYGSSRAYFVNPLHSVFF